MKGKFNFSTPKNQFEKKIDEKSKKAQLFKRI